MANKVIFTLKLMHRFPVYTVQYLYVMNTHTPYTTFSMPKRMFVVEKFDMKGTSKGTVYKAYCNAFVTAPEIIPLAFY